MPPRTRVHVLSGFLGTGKTTALRHLTSQRPARETWALLVNEFGTVGIDGALLAPGGDGVPHEGGLVLRELPGGCICCSAGFFFRATATLLLAQVRPDRLFIEPTGLAEPHAIIDTFRSAGLAEAVALQPVITLVDPTHWADPRYREHEVYQAQVHGADLLLANRTDLAPPEATAAFLAEARTRFPPPLEVGVITQGRIDIAWLDRVAEATDAAGPPSLRVIPRGAIRRLAPHALALSPETLHRPAPLATPEPPPPPTPGAWPGTPAKGVASCGWLFDADTIFCDLRLHEVLTELAAWPGLLRLKGVFHTPAGWIAVNATPAQLASGGSAYRRDSRVELLVRTTEPPDWDAVEALLHSAFLHDANADERADRDGEGDGDTRATVDDVPVDAPF